MNLQKSSVRKEVEISEETGGYRLMTFGCVLSKVDLKTLSTNQRQVSGEKNMEQHCEGLPKRIRKCNKNGAGRVPKL